MTFKKLSDQIKWDLERCKFCGLCTFVCPKKALSKDSMEIKHNGECIKCKMCQLNCPDFAIYLIEDPKNQINKKNLKTNHKK